MVEKALYALLTADTLVAGFTANADGTYRIGPHPPQTEGVPFVRYMRVSSTPVRSLSGPTGLRQARVQLDCCSPRYDEAAQLAEAVRLCLDGYPGSAGHTSAGGVTVQALLLEDERDIPEEPADASDRPWFVRTLDVMCAFNETP